jgi:hypothetical protein
MTRHPSRLPSEIWEKYNPDTPLSPTTALYFDAAVSAHIQQRQVEANADPGHDVESYARGQARRMEQATGMSPEEYQRSLLYG